MYLTYVHNSYYVVVSSMYCIYFYRHKDPYIFQEIIYSTVSEKMPIRQKSTNRLLNS